MRSEIQIIADGAYDQFMAATRGAIPVDEVRAAVEHAVLQAIHDGQIEVDAVFEQWAQNIARLTDQRKTELGKSIIRKIGQGHTPMTSLLGDVHFPLGKGQRVLFRHMTMDTLLQADQTRYDEHSASEAAYRDWRKVFSRLAPVLQKTGMTLEEAYDSGMITDTAEAEKLAS